MEVEELLVELAGRLPELVRGAVEGLDEAELTWAPADGANTIAWLIWHIARVEDHQLSEVAGAEQAYVAGGWPARFGRGADEQDLGYGHTAEDVASVRGTAEDLLAHHDAVNQRTLAYLGSLTASDLDRIVDDRWDPPVTLGVRLVSVLDDCVQHAGQAAYLRGLLPSSRSSSGSP